MFGFGYDSLSNTYKVGAIISYMNSKEELFETEVKVWNKGSNCWKNIINQSSVPNLAQHGGGGVVYLSGTLNWLASSNFNYGWDVSLSIVSLDLGRETCRKYSLP